jgi:hypothetical protein
VKLVTEVQKNTIQIIINSAKRGLLKFKIKTPVAMPAANV